MFSISLLKSKFRPHLGQSNKTDPVDMCNTNNQLASSVYYQSFPTKEEYDALYSFIVRKHIEIVDDIDFEMDCLSFVFRAACNMTPCIIKNWFESNDFSVNICRELHSVSGVYMKSIFSVPSLLRNKKKFFQITISADSQYFRNKGLLPCFLDKSKMLSGISGSEKNYNILQTFLKEHDFRVIDNIDILPYNYEFYFENTRFSSSLEVKEWFEQEGFSVTSVQFRNWTAETYLRPEIKFRSSYTRGVMFFIVRLGMDSAFFSYVESHVEEYSDLYNLAGVEV